MSDVSSHSLDSVCTTDIDPSLSPQQADDLTGCDSCVRTVAVPLYIDTLIHKAYGAPLICSVGGPFNSVWCQHWSIIIQHRGLLYSLPGGTVGKHYVELLNEELKLLCNGVYPAERVLVFSAIVLQRDRSVCKGSDIRRLLNRRLSLWRDGSFDVLLQEAECCDKALRNSYSSNTTRTTDHLVKVFTKLMLQGNIRAAVRWITERAGGGVLRASDTTHVNQTVMSVMDALKLKHPESQIPPESALPCCDSLPYFEDSEITAAHVRTVACRLQGGAGPGGCDSKHWKDVLLRFGSASGHLRETIAGFCRSLCNSIIPWDNIRALLASRLIALDKCPGVRPIGVGETLRRIVGKAICSVTRFDASVVCGSDQLCAGLQCGIEGAIHAMNELFDANLSNSSGWGVLLIDASNAFNSLNRISMLLHVRKLWPRCARFVFNTYRGWPVLVMRGMSDYILSKEGVTQGDPLSMYVYAIGTLPLIQSLQSPQSWTQLWYADDASAGGLLSDLRDWFSLLCSRGPRYGYFPEPSKCFVVVAPSRLSLAREVFGDLGVRVVTGHRFLGGFIGDSGDRQNFVLQKVLQWSGHVRTLAAVASSQPQAAFAALTKSLQSE